MRQRKHRSASTAQRAARQDTAWPQALGASDFESHQRTCSGLFKTAETIAAYPVHSLRALAHLPDTRQRADAQFYSAQVSSTTEQSDDGLLKDQSFSSTFTMVFPIP